MPFQSESQRRFMYSQHPEIARKWSAEYPHQGPLPEHVERRKTVAEILLQRKGT